MTCPWSWGNGFMRRERMAQIDFDIECGICGTNIDAEPDFNSFGMTMVVTCPECKKLNEKMEDRVGELEDKISDLEMEAESHEN